MFDGIGFTEGLKLYFYKKKCLVATFLPFFCRRQEMKKVDYAFFLSDLGTAWTIKCVKSRSSKVVFLDPLVILIRMRVLISFNKY